MDEKQQHNALLLNILQNIRKRGDGIRIGGKTIIRGPNDQNQISNIEPARRKYGHLIT